jgi:hypothetical protein
MARKLRQLNALRTKYWPDTVGYSPILESITKPAMPLPKWEKQVLFMVDLSTEQILR